MLQRNATAHVAHIAVVGVHAACCGLPAAAMLAAALSGAATAATVLPPALGAFHRVLHGYELWVLLFSGALVVIGAWLEIVGRRHAHAFPWLFAFSAACFFVNAVLILAHQS